MIDIGKDRRRVPIGPDQAQVGDIHHVITIGIAQEPNVINLLRCSVEQLAAVVDE